MTPHILKDVRGTVAALKLMFVLNARRSLASPGPLIIGWITSLIINTVSLAFWLILAQAFGGIGSYTQQDMIMLWGIAAVALGIFIVFLSEIVRLPILIASGELDSLLLRPQAPIAALVTGAVDLSALPDIAFGLFVIFVLGDPDAGQLVFAGISIVLVIAIVFGFLLAVNALCFFSHALEGVARQMASVYIQLSSFPQSVFSPALQIVFLVLLPAGYTSALAHRVVTGEDPLFVLVALAMAIIWCLLGWVVLSLGLRRYTAGSGDSIGLAR